LNKRIPEIKCEKLNYKPVYLPQFQWCSKYGVTATSARTILGWVLL
jgi:hypothetical protein